MSQNEPDGVEIEDGEDTTITVVDPDDYQQTRKLKAINDAKAHVRELRESYPTTASSRDWNGLHSRTAEAIAMYANELLPLIEDAIDRGILDEDDLQTPFGSIIEFAAYDGRFPNEDEDEFMDLDPGKYMWVYRQLGRIERKLGLGLELQEDETDEWEV